MTEKIILKKITKNMLNSSKQIKYSALLSYFSIALNILVGLFFTPWLVRKIGQSDFGLYTLCISFISLFIFDFGLSIGVSRYLSLYFSKNETEKIKKFLGIIYKIYFSISILIFIIFIVLYFNIEKIYSNFNQDEIIKLKFILLIVGFFNIITISTKPLEGILIASERFIFIKSVNIFNKLSTVFLLIVLLKFGYGLYALVLTNIFVNLLVIISRFFYIKKFIGFEVDFKFWDNKLFREIFVFSFWISLSAIFQRLILNIMPSIIGIFTNTIQIAIFSIGMTIEGYTWTISNALNGLFLPKVTRILVNNNSQHFNQVMLKLGRIQLFIVGFIIVAFFIFGKDFMLLWMGEKFNNSYWVALLLILPFIIIQTQEIPQTALLVVNEVKYKALSTIIISIVSIALSSLFSIKYGAIGAALGVMVAKIIGLIVFLNIIYYRLFKIDIFKFFIDCHLKNSPLFLIMLIFGFFIQKYFPLNNFYTFILKLGTFSIVYFLLLWLFFLNDYEKSLFYDVKRKAKQIFNIKT
ncbi:MAG: Polysaccharide biosynthesis protein [candidate division TA06 bacterium 32_111]|uniref:Polysaccharide biosynthesis protein n=2 Tax=Bacteria candidate phyla TaxID=1783234 RepID=A0A101I499_UNCT6|nr:MAG: Polysaccharide biosynthesis protein [candidate division TA06 bacterium 32_111]KUK88003.1 MAG: Polysaccharide biosynthesis protein [candidate division TA06 bacterium 34_109]HAF06931.1 polysaccharide biosynthesis protein [candidate division WOR-3 bacterium]HCP16845.1 polysaccharide biosynthesis protein [candidate division WOR-3 bacterium]